MIRQAKFKERIWYEPSRIERMLEKETAKYGFRLSEAKIKYTSDCSREELDRTTGKLNGKKTAMMRSILSSLSLTKKYQPKTSSSI